MLPTADPAKTAPIQHAACCEMFAFTLGAIPDYNWLFAAKLMPAATGNS
jgi:hypothetical protein